MEDRSCGNAAGPVGAAEVPPAAEDLAPSGGGAGTLGFVALAAVAFVVALAAAIALLAAFGWVLIEGLGGTAAVVERRALVLWACAGLAALALSVKLAGPGR